MQQGKTDLGTGLPQSDGVRPGGKNPTKMPVQDHPHKTKKLGTTRTFLHTNTHITQFPPQPKYLRRCSACKSVFTEVYLLNVKKEESDD